FLNAAGYPKSSVLPASYRPAAAAPLVTVAAPPAANAAEGREANAARNVPAARPVQPPANISNPAGIKF
ncbi:MAG: glutaredoxin, partial [Polaromonas sp.]|nr:glutaredoxin [Polaromonas sp.]